MAGQLNELGLYALEAVAVVLPLGKIFGQAPVVCQPVQDAQALTPQLLDLYLVLRPDVPLA